jgi:hypothetical protein
MHREHGCKGGLRLRPWPTCQGEKTPVGSEGQLEIVEDADGTLGLTESEPP